MPNVRVTHSFHRLNMAHQMHSPLVAALKQHGCSDEDIPRVRIALEGLGLTAPSDWSTDLIQESDFKLAGLSVLLSRKAAHANAT